MRLRELDRSLAIRSGVALSLICALSMICALAALAAGSSRAHGIVRVAHGPKQTPAVASDASFLQVESGRTVYIFQPVSTGEGPWVRPKRIPLSNHSWFAELRWRDWGRRVARATGVLVHNACIPNCAASTTLRRYRVVMTATAITRCMIKVYRNGRYRTTTLWLYNRVTIRYLGTRPSGYPVTNALPPPCASR